MDSIRIIKSYFTLLLECTCLALFRTFEYRIMKSKMIHNRRWPNSWKRIIMNDLHGPCKILLRSISIRTSATLTLQIIIKYICTQKRSSNERKYYHSNNPFICQNNLLLNPDRLIFIGPPHKMVMAEQYNLVGVLRTVYRNVSFCESS